MIEDLEFEMSAHVIVGKYERCGILIPCEDLSLEFTSRGFFVKEREERVPTLYRFARGKIDGYEDFRRKISARRFELFTGKEEIMDLREGTISYMPLTPIDKRFLFDFLTHNKKYL
ncbi:MAG: hypothetical protein AABY40_01910 [Nanoarchaeota archaeon]